MTEYISREQIFKKFLNEGDGYYSLSHLRDVIRSLPAADVQPVEHSRWIPMNDGTYNAYCENCGHERGSKAWNKADYKYCPNCGARMDGDFE